MYYHKAQKVRVIFAHVK